MYANDYLKSPTFHLLNCISKKWIRHVVIRMFVFTTGNAYIHALTMLGYTHLKIEVMTFDTIVYSIEYPNFQIGDSTENYMLRSLGTPIITSAGQIFLKKRIGPISKFKESIDTYCKRYYFYTIYFLSTNWNLFKSKIYQVFSLLTSWNILNYIRIKWMKEKGKKNKECKIPFFELFILTYNFFVK